MSEKQCLLSLNVPPKIEGLMVDCLLVLESARGFSSFPVSAHDHINHGLSLAEQVIGRQRKIRFQIEVLESELPALLHHIKQSFTGAGIEYWVTPVIAKGVI